MNILVVIGEVAYDGTQGKILFLVELLRQYGYDPMLLCWTDRVAQAAQAHGFPLLRITPQEQPAVDAVAEAKQVAELLTGRIDGGDTPSWARLLAFDDFIGSVQAWGLSSLGGYKPDVIIKSVPGGESSTPQDEQVELALHRFATWNRIPRIGVEVQRLDGPLSISRWPVDVLLTKQVYPSWTGLSPALQQTAQLRPAHRHYCRYGMDQMLEGFLPQEKELRERLSLPPDKAVFFMPFHLYYTEECRRLLRSAWESLGKSRQQNDVHLAVSVGNGTRRSLSERDIFMQGCKREWQPWGAVQVLENADTMAMLLLSDAVLLPYHMAVLEDMCRKWEVPLWTLQRETHRLLPWATPIDAIEACRAAVQDAAATPAERETA